jgi:hypothetical protein
MVTEYKKQVFGFIETISNIYSEHNNTKEEVLRAAVTIQLIYVLFNTIRTVTIFDHWKWCL